MHNRYGSKIICIAGRFERGVKGKADFIPQRHFACRRAIFGAVSAFEKPEMADVVDRRIRAVYCEGRLASGGEARAFGEERIEDDARAGVCFAPDAEKAG